MAAKILGMQQTLGNQAVQQRASTCPAFPSACPTGGACHTCPARVQAKLAISQPGDPYEQEADRVAEQVMRMPENKAVSGQLSAVRKNGMNAQRGQNLEGMSDVGSRINAMQGGGQPLPESARAFFEPRFGRDFSRVRVHTDARAVESAQAVNALSYTVGRDMVFGAGQFAPTTRVGRQLMAHELTHVVQQRMSYHFIPILQRADVPTGIRIKEARPFGHSNLASDELKKKWRTYIGSTTLMQVTPSGDYTKHCVKEYLTEVANTCPPRFLELRKEGFCTESKCLDINRYGTAGDPDTEKTVTDGPDSFIDRHRTRHPESLLEGAGKDKCSVVCHQRYKYDRKNDLGSFYVIRNFKADKYTPPGSKDALHITTGEVQKAPAVLEAPSKGKFAKDIAPGLVKSGVLIEAPPVPKEEK
jgi:hypothetical protein